VKKKIFYTVKETTEALGLGVTAVYTLLASGKLRARKLNTTTLIEGESIDELAESLPRGKFTTNAAKASGRAKNLRSKTMEGEADTAD
jgi:excisionase family DNA binding protein